MAHLRSLNALLLAKLLDLTWPVHNTRTNAVSCFLAKYDLSKKKVLIDFFCTIDCANEIHNDGHPVAASQCSMTCAGNSSEFCGAGFRLNVYTIEGAHEIPEQVVEVEEDPTPTPTEDAQDVGDWTYLGCYT